MGYSIELTSPDTGEVIQMSKTHHMKGSTYVIGGTRDASLNITYNYSGFYHRVFPTREGTDGQVVGGIRYIYGMTGQDSVPVLSSAIQQLGSDVTDNYWDATEGNAQVQLAHLLVMASAHPDGIWKGD